MGHGYICFGFVNIWDALPIFQTLMISCSLSINVLVHSSKKNNGSTEVWQKMGNTPPKYLQIQNERNCGAES